MAGDRNVGGRYAVLYLTMTTRKIATTSERLLEVFGADVKRDSAHRNEVGVGRSQPASLTPFSVSRDPASAHALKWWSKLCTRPHRAFGCLYFVTSQVSRRSTVCVSPLQCFEDRDVLLEKSTAEVLHLTWLERSRTWTAFDEWSNFSVIEGRYQTAGINSADSLDIRSKRAPPPSCIRSAHP